MQSSNSLKVYQIDLIAKTCNCGDFPCILLCKHIAAVSHFFGGADLGPQPPDDSSNITESQDGNGDDSMDDNAAASILLAANDIVRLSQEFITKVPSNLRILNSLNTI